jgi:hypothetical protein
LGYIFLDESGDLGFDFTKAKTSRYFLITFLFAEQKGQIEKIVKKTFQEFKRTGIKHPSGVLHCNSEQPKVRSKVLSRLSEKNISVLCIYLDKRKVYTQIQDEKPVLYNYVTNILLDRVFTKKLIALNSPIELIASRRETNKFLNENFKGYLEGQAKQKHGLQLQISIRQPSQEQGLQVVDFVCWAMFRKREHGDESYYNLIKSKVVEESSLFG